LNIFTDTSIRLSIILLHNSNHIHCKINILLQGHTF